MTEPKRPRALTYTEMMNGGRQHLDEAEHIREQELQKRVGKLERDAATLEQALQDGVMQKRKAAPPDGKTA